MKIIIEENVGWNSVKVYGYKEDPAGAYVYGFNGTTLIEQKLKVGDVGQKIIPLMEIPYHMFNEIASAFVEAATRKGITLEKDDHLKGQLVATKDHLADMQKLVFQLADHLTKNKK